MLSVIIPALNAAGQLERTLAAVAEGGPALERIEVIVVDGGSSDATVSIAGAADAKVIEAKKGRGSQLSAGARHATGDWLLFVHADTRLENNWGQVVKAFVSEQSRKNQQVAAAFRFKLDDRSFMAGLLERIVQFRTRWLALPYGDQGLLISRAHYDEIGGFSDIPIMEDVDIVRRIGRKRLITLGCFAETSAERYRREGYLRRMARNISCLAMWFCGVAPERIVERYR